MTVTRKDIHDRAKALQDALARFNGLARQLRSEKAEAQREKGLNNMGNYDLLIAKAEARFQEAADGLYETISARQAELNEALDEWRSQADPMDPLISQATAILGATGRNTPASITDALIAQADRPYQLQYLRTLFDQNGMSLPSNRAKERGEALTPEPISAGLGTAVYVGVKHGSTDGGIDRTIADAYDRCASISEAFAESGDGGAE